MEMSTERHVTDAYELARLAKAVDTLINLGRPRNTAVYDIAHNFGLTKADVLALVKLIK